MEDWTYRIFVRVSGDDEREASEAFETLCASSRLAGYRMLSRSGVREADAEDILQSAFAELWNSRKTLSAATPGSWYSLVRRSVMWQLSKRISKNEREKFLSEQVIPVDELPYLDEMVFASDERRKLYTAADDLWLGQMEEDLVFGVAAARLVLVEGLGIEDVATMFEVSEHQVARWLRVEALLARAAYLGLCWPVEKLAGYVLRPDCPLTPDELDRVMSPEGFSPGMDWSAAEARIVCWRLRNGMSKRDIVRASGGEHDLLDVEAVLKKLHAALPLQEIAQSMRQGLTEVGRPNALALPGIWKRLAFHYALKELSNSQIIDLVAPPASVAPFLIDAAKLNRWVTSGVLFSQLASFVREQRV